MLIPPYLKAGDAVAIVATARKISREELAPAITILEGYGLRVLCAPNLFEQEHQFAGSDHQRAIDLQWSVDHPEVKAIICARGGYGTVRIIDHVNLHALKTNPRWIVGYSDITVLHSTLLNMGLASIHGTMPINFTKHREATESLKKALFGEPIRYSTETQPLNRQGHAEGIVCGGNLSLLYALAGTPSDIDTTGKILFLEDLDEYLYHIDRMILQLKRSGKLSNLAGLVVGGMSDMKDNTIPFGKTAEEIVAEAVSEYKYPVCFGFPAGHIDRNLALYMGRKAMLDVTAAHAVLSY
ncbi:MAG: LD-carboxypeptidase [Bacteroidetes bacterium]|nr:LD-carboxypeptidase [Bacteroidota bacterium]